MFLMAADPAGSNQNRQYFYQSNEIPFGLSALFQQSPPQHIHTLKPPTPTATIQRDPTAFSSLKVMTGRRSCGFVEGVSWWGVYERCGSCFDLSEMCAADKHNRSFHSAPAAPPTPRPTRQLNPSLCVPHSCMDLSALGRGAALCGGGGAGQR